MPLVIVGINHRTAPVEIREKIVFGGAELPAALRELSALPAVRESVILSTCNRTEIYCHADSTEVGLVSWLEHWHDLAATSVHQCLYQHQATQAVTHIFNVATGLDSMVLGEPQILGQLKEAYRCAQHTGATGPYLNRLFQAAFSVAKRVRTQTRIGANAVSVASAAVALARNVFERFDEQTVLLVGAGETISLAARHLHANGVKRMIIANRSLERATELALEFNAYAVSLDALNVHLPEADILLTSTASPTPVITYDAVVRAIKARKRRPMFMVDIAVPRDIDPRIGDLEDVYLFTIDDIESVVNENIASRRAAARDADRLIAAEVLQFEQQMKTLDAVPAIRQLREDAEALRSQTLAQAQRMLAKGRSPNEAMEFLASTLTNRLIHSPSQRLRTAAENGETDIIRAAQELFARRDHKDESVPEGNEPADG